MIKEKESLVDDVIRTLAYFDIFNYPLTNEQVYKFLPKNSVTQADIATMLEEMANQKLIVRCGDFYCLSRSDRAMATERKENEMRARRFSKYARLVTRLLKWFPFIRGVFITGSLSKNVATKESDIDFMIVTEPQRLWISKALLTVFRKFFLFGNNRYFCTNYYISEKYYRHPERNIFSAIEIVTTKAAWNTGALKKYLEANAWIRDYLPNYDSAVDGSFAINEKRLWPQRIFEAMLSVLPLTVIDTALMNYFNRYWRRRYHYLKAEKRDSLFRTTPDVSSVWKNDQQEIILDRYRKKLHEYGLQ